MIKSFFGFSIIACLFASPAFAQSLPPVDLVVVYKAQRLMELYHNGDVVKSYHVALGREPQGPKLREGDGRTPEGLFTIIRRNPNSKYHRALAISYPRAQDVSRAILAGSQPGGQIMIHGLPNGRSERSLDKDWTDGCIALSNSEIEEVYDAVPEGTSVAIMP